MSAKYRGTTLYFHVLAELVRAAQYRGVTTYQDIAVIMGLPQKEATWGAQSAKCSAKLWKMKSHQEDRC